MMNIRRKFWDIKMKIFSLLNKDAKILYDTNEGTSNSRESAVFA